MLFRTFVLYRRKNSRPTFAGTMKHCILLTFLTIFWAQPALAEQVEIEGAEAAPEAQPEQSGESEADQSVVEARERVSRGEQLFTQGNYDAALVEFQQAYDIIGDHPNRYLILYNIGQCHERSFRYDLALRFYNEYLEEGGPEADGRDRVTEEIARLEGLLANILIEVNLESAEVWIDERNVGTAPGTIRIPGGLHVIEIRAPGHLTSRQELRIPAGGQEHLDIVLEPLPERFEGLHQAYFWSSAGVGLASLIAGIALGITAFQSHNEVDRQLENERDKWNVTTEDIDRIGNLALSADILFGSAALFTVGAIILGVLTNWGDDEESENRSSRYNLQIAGGPQSGSVVFTANF